MKDAQGFERGHCFQCECLEYSPVHESADCDYCGHKPTQHQLSQFPVKCLRKDPEDDSGTLVADSGVQYDPADLEFLEEGSARVAAALRTNFESIRTDADAITALHSVAGTLDGHPLDRAVAGSPPTAALRSLQLATAHANAPAPPRAIVASARVKYAPEHIYLVRNGESEATVNWRIMEYTADHLIGLTDVGKAQGRALGRDLRRRVGTKRVMFYVSPYRRTVQTFECIAESLDDGQYELFLEPRLREQDCGNFLKPEEMEETKKERKKYGTFFYRVRNGESGADVYDRVSTMLETLHRDWHRPTFPQEMVIITHGLTMRLFLMRWFHWSVAEFERTSNPCNAEVYVMTRQPTGKYLLDRPLRKRTNVLSEDILT